MKKAFTLIELLVVTLVIAILASILFKLAGSVEGKSELQTTIIRMQKLENCLSGYYAAFGCYPPVPLQGRSRNPFCPLKKDVIGPLIQDVDAEPNYGVYKYNIRGGDACAEAACRAQPVKVMCPYPKWDKDEGGRTPADEWNDETQAILQQDPESMKNYIKDGYTGVQPFAGDDGSRNDGSPDEWRWPDKQRFCFGLMSFLLPRYLLMMGCENSDLYALYQWDGNNSLPCRYDSGVPYSSWRELNNELKYMLDDPQGQEYRAKVGLIPSQAITQRWLPNLEGICARPKAKELKFYDINVIGDEIPADPKHAENHSKFVFPGGTSPDVISVLDGWEEEFFYYSPPPYQNYRLWSSGKNKVTFPPWFTEEEMKEHYDKRMEYMNSSMETKEITVADAIADDIVHLSH